MSDDDFIGLYSAVLRKSIYFACLVDTISHNIKLKLAVWFVGSFSRWLFCTEKCYLRYLIGTR